MSALESLDRSLRQHGSALMVRVGAWEDQVPQLAAELKASGIVAELEVEAGGQASLSASQLLCVSVPQSTILLRGAAQLLACTLVFCWLRAASALAWPWWDVKSPPLDLGWG